MTAQQHKELLQAYLRGSLEFDALETHFNACFNGEEEITEELFLALDSAWGSIHSCWPDLPPDEGTRFKITEATLRTELTDVVARLERYVASGKA